MRLIDGDALLEAMKKRKEYVGRLSDPVCLVGDAPTVDAVPVVRCKDCKYAHMTYDGECKYCQLDIDRGYTDAAYRDGDWFCADGERREEDG